MLFNLLCTYYKDNKFIIIDFEANILRDYDEM